MSVAGVLARGVHAVGRRRRLLLGAAGTALLGAVVGFVVGVVVPAHTDIVGSDTAVTIRPGQTYDQFGVTGVLMLKRATTRALLGEPLGVRASVNLDVSQLIDSNGKFDTKLLPAYISGYSDPAQLAGQIRDALIGHLVLYTVAGGAAALIMFGAVAGYRRWRARYDRRHWPRSQDRAVGRAYRRPERVLVRRSAIALVLLVALGSVGSSQERQPPDTTLHPTTIFDGTPLEGAEVDGLLRPALTAAQSYIQTYFGETDVYYDQLRAALAQQLDRSPVTLPTGNNVVQLGFVTDRHCNIGMDRVVISLLKRYRVNTLVSGGDDAFSGSFPFESTCTSGLAQRSKKAGITDVMVAGNHDSAQTVRFEREQGMRTLRGQIVTVHGLRFLGSPDPRTSRYDQGIVPSSQDAQHRVIDEQAAKIVRTACRYTGPIVAVLHDPRAGMDSLDRGCGRITLALDGHTHTQSGPHAHVISGGGTGYQFTGASSGGAPKEHDIEQNFASRLTVGPLNHSAAVNIVSVNRTTGALVGMTEFHFSPEQEITVDQQLMPPA
jgi:hypothetical protein